MNQTGAGNLDFFITDRSHDSGGGQHQGASPRNRASEPRGGTTEHDEVTYASRLFRDRDPPGQSCFYIMPGDHRDSSYRLSTFVNFPNKKVKIYDLTEAGFYYTGYEDRTKCFSCGLGVQHWMSADSPSDSKWHESDCLMAHGRDLQNVVTDSTPFRNIMRKCSAMPSFAAENMEIGRNHQYHQAIPNRSQNMTIHDVTSNMSQFHINDKLPDLTLARVQDEQHKNWLKELHLNKESDRRKTYSKWPSYPAPFMSGRLAKEGFFFLGNLDRVQCFSCSGVLRNWGENDDVGEQHRVHFPNCRLHRGLDPRNQEMTQRERAEADEEDRKRLSTLLPNGDVNEPPNPSPAEQHHLKLHLPCLNPINPGMASLSARINSFKGWPANKMKVRPEQMAKAGLYFLGEADKTKCFYCNGGLQNWCYEDEPWTEHAKWFPGCEFVSRHKGTKFVKNILAAHPNLNRPLIRNEINLCNIPDFRDSLSQIGCSLETQDKSLTTSLERNVEQAQACANAKRQSIQNSGEQQPIKKIRCDDSASSSTTDEAGLNSIKEKEESMLCKSCKTNKADTVIVDCGHLTSCSQCASNMKRCNTCNRRITNTVKIFRA